MNKFILDLKIYTLPILSGFLLALTQPLFDMTFLVWIAFIPFLYFIERTQSTKELFIGSLLTGVLYMGAVLYPLFTLNAWWWLDIPILFENRIIIWLWGIGALVLFGAFFQFGLFAMVAKKIISKHFLALLALPLLWLILEIARESIVQGFTWGHIGYGLYNHIYLLQLAGIGGVYSLSCFVFFMNILLYKIYIMLREDFQDKKKPRYLLAHSGWHILLFIVLMGGANTYGYIQVNKPTAELNINVAVLQDNIKTEEANSFTAREQLEQIKEVLLQSPTLLVLPENAFPAVMYEEESGGILLDPFFSTIDDEIHFNTLLNLSSVHASTSIIIGINTLDEQQHKHNSVMVIERGEVTDIYHKREQLPFSERAFYKGWLPRNDIQNTITASGITIAPLICSEVNNPHLLSKETGEIIVIIGNDSVFNSNVAAKTHQRMARLRAVENRKFVVRAMKTGISSVINPFGRQIDVLPINQNGFLIVSI